MLGLRRLCRGPRHSDFAHSTTGRRQDRDHRPVYADLVAGRVASAQSRFPASLEHYVSALTLFPDAQSALLGASQAAAMTGDVETALSFVHRLGSRSKAYESDPWWSYQLGSGREVKALIAALWARVEK